MKKVRVTKLFSIQNKGKLEAIFNTDLNLHSSIGDKEKEFRAAINDCLLELEKKLREILNDSSNNV